MKKKMAVSIQKCLWSSLLGTCYKSVITFQKEKNTYPYNIYKINLEEKPTGREALSEE